MARYAQGTTIDPATTEQDIKRLLRSHGASGIAIAEHSSYGGAPDRIQVAFELAGRHIRFDARLPHPDDPRYAHDGSRYRFRERPRAMQRAAWEQDVRQRWRALLLRIRSRLEELEDLCAQDEADGHGTQANKEARTQEVFLDHVVLAGGQTLGEWAGPQIAEAYRSGRVPDLLPGATRAPAILLGPAEEER